MKWLFLAYLILNPLFFWHRGDISAREAQELFFRLSSIFIVFAGMFFHNKKIVPNKMNSALAVLGTWVLYLFAARQCSDGWFIVMNLFLTLGVYFTFIRTMTKKDLVFLLNAFKVVLCITAFWVLGQKMGYDPVFKVIDSAHGGVFEHAFDMMGPFGIKSHMGGYVGMTATVFMLSTPFVALFLAPLIVVSVSTGAAMAYVGSILFYLWFRAKKIFYIMLVPILLFGVLFVVKVDNPLGMQNTRFDMWGKVTHDAMFHPILGHGLDSFRNGKIRFYKQCWSDVTVRAEINDDHYRIEGEMPKFWVDKMAEDKAKGHRISALDFWDHPHNEYIYILYEFGVVGLVMFFVVVYCMWRRFKNAYQSKLLVMSAAMIFGMLLYNMTQFSFHVSRLGHLVPIILGIFFIESEVENG